MKSSEPMHTLISSNGTSLRLTDEEYQQFAVERHQLYLRWKKIEISRRGIYATNQGKYVKTLAELNDWDSRPTKEELE